MIELHLAGARYGCAPGETVLECLERHGAPAPSSCRSGVCLTCLMRAVEGEIPREAQSGLRDTLAADRYFKACVCKPAGPMTLAFPASGALETPMVVELIRELNMRVIEVRLRPERPLEYRAGQFINLRRADGLVRSYSLASVPALDDGLVLHVALMPGGAMSGWLHREARPGDRLDALGPYGHCFYLASDPEQPLFLLGTGTGLAPLYGIVRDALRQGHRGPIHLFHGSLEAAGLYLVEELRALEAAHPNLRYYPCALNGSAYDGVHIGPIDTYALDTVPSLAGHRVYLCGHPDMVKLMQRKTFLAGASLQAIFADAFVASKQGAR